MAFVTTRLAAGRVGLERLEIKIGAIKADTELLLEGQEAEKARAAERHTEVMAGQAELPDAIVNKLLAELDARGALHQAQEAGLERQAIIKIARRLRPEEALDFDQALVELEKAVEVAFDVIAKGERGTNFDAFVDAVLAQVAEKTRVGEFDSAARSVDEALAELDRREMEQRTAFRRSRVALLEAGVEQDILRRDERAVAHRIEAIVDVDQPDGRPAWSAAFRERYDRFYEEGETKGINFSLLIAVELARRMTDAARDGDERGTADILLGTALATLGERESGRAGRRVWRRRSRPTARRCRKGRATGCRCNGRRRR